MEVFMKDESNCITNKSNIVHHITSIVERIDQLRSHIAMNRRNDSEEKCKSGLSQIQISQNDSTIYKMKDIFQTTMEKDLLTKCYDEANIIALTAPDRKMRCYK